MTSPLSDRRLLAEQNLALVLRESSGLELGQLNRSATFLELGFDSLFLIQLSQRLKRRFGVKVAFRQLIEEISTVDGLLSYLADHGSFESKSSALGAAENQTDSPNGSSTADPRTGMAEHSRQVQATGESSLTASVAEPRSFLQPTTTPTQQTPQSVRIAPSIVASVAATPSIRPNGSGRESLADPAFGFALPQVQAGYTGSRSAVEQIILQQNALMLRHLEIMSGASSVVPVLERDIAPATPAPASSPEPQISSRCEIASSASPESTRQKSFERFGPYKPVRRGQLVGGLTEQQQKHLSEFMQRYTRRTAKSRQHAQMYRSQFADPRGVAGYRRIWKSMVYQIVVERSKGAKLWDIDGNEYIDIAMGFGLNLFGQSPDFITQALHRQLDCGVEVGPQSPVAGEVAALLCQFSRKDRVTFCNTGSEAVMAALRLARTVTGKSKTVYFNKDYHGNFDQVLLRSQMVNDKPGSAPAAPGVPQWYAQNTLVLPYGDPESLKIIRDQADDIAAVLVEPVQSADPFIQPREFLHELRDITRQHQIALVMDEVITGFRAAQGGAQEWYGVWGDMATYGKILGGGMPIGALAGTSEYMNGLDGGDWRYEDESEPDADMTFFAGTFVRHPLAMAAAYEVLKKVKEEGPQLQQQLTDRTTHLASTLNRFFEEQQFPIRVAQFTSLFRMMFPPDLEFADMLYFHLLDRGIFTRGWGDNCFLSTAHTDEDVERIIRAVQESCLEIRQAGFFPERDSQEPRLAENRRCESQNAPSYCDIPSAADEKKNKSAEQFAPSSHNSVTDGIKTDRMSTVNPIRQEGSLPPLFCLPAADGLTLVYHELAECLGSDQPVYGLDTPAIYREPIPDTLEELAARFIEDMKEVQPHGPYLLAGYCSGGTTALEVAQQLRRSGEQVAFLALIETYNWLDAPSTNPTVWVQASYQYERLKFHWYNFLLLNWSQKSEFMRSKWESLKKRTKVWKAAALGWFSRQTINRQGLVNMAEIWRKHDQIAEAYVPQPYPGRLLHFRPRKDYRCHLGTEYQARSLEIIRLPVYPAGMMANPFVQQLAREMQEQMRRGLKEIADEQKNSCTECEAPSLRGEPVLA